MPTKRTKKADKMSSSPKKTTLKKVTKRKNPVKNAAVIENVTAIEFVRELDSLHIKVKHGNATSNFSMDMSNIVHCNFVKFLDKMSGVGKSGVLKPRDAKGALKDANKVTKFSYDRSDNSITIVTSDEIIQLVASDWNDCARSYVYIMNK
jgi:hypothetical protein